MGHAYMNYEYSQILTRTKGSLIYIEPPPARTPATISLEAQAGLYHSQNPLTLTNKDYWQWVANAPIDGMVVVTHTTDMVREAPVLTRVSPLELVNEAAHDLTIGLDSAESGARYGWVHCSCQQSPS